MSKIIYFIFILSPNVVNYLCNSPMAIFINAFQSFSENTQFECHDLCTLLYISNLKILTQILPTYYISLFMLIQFCGTMQTLFTFLKNLTLWDFLTHGITFISYIALEKKLTRGVILR